MSTTLFRLPAYGRMMSMANKMSSFRTSPIIRFNNLRTSRSNCAVLRRWAAQTVVAATQYRLEKSKWVPLVQNEVLGTSRMPTVGGTNRNAMYAPGPYYARTNHDHPRNTFICVLAKHSTTGKVRPGSVKGKQERLCVHGDKEERWRGEGST